MTKAKEALWAIVGHVTLSLIPESFTAVCFLASPNERRILGLGKKEKTRLAPSAPAQFRCHRNRRDSPEARPTAVLGT